MFDVSDGSDNPSYLGFGRGWNPRSATRIKNGLGISHQAPFFTFFYNKTIEFLQNV